MAPSFFKILLDPSAPNLPLPPAFVDKHLNNIPKNPTLRSATGGHSWRLKVEKIEESYCFSHGWKTVVEDTQLGYGDFLVFFLVDQNTFKVRIYAPSGCEKDLPSKLQVEDNGGSVDDYSDSDSDGGDDDEDDDDDDDGGDIDGNDGDPFFMTKIHKNILRLPRKFVKLAGINAQKTITVKNLADEEWRTSLRSEEKNRYCLSAGWRDFCRGNELSEGDECIFKFIRSEGKMSLVKVAKKKMAARQSPAKIPATGMGKGKRKRGRPPRSDRNDIVEVVQRRPGRPPIHKSKSSVVYF